MRLGIDFGTTRIVVASLDRGNYPVVSFEPPDGAARDWFPPLVAVQDRACFSAGRPGAVQEEPGWTVVRSLKRALERPARKREVHIGGQTCPCCNC